MMRQQSMDEVLEDRGFTNNNESILAAQAHHTTAVDIQETARRYSVLIGSTIQSPLTRPHPIHATPADEAFIPSPVLNANADTSQTAIRSLVPPYEQAVDDMDHAPIVSDNAKIRKKDANGDYIPQEPEGKQINTNGYPSGREGPGLGRPRTPSMMAESQMDVLSLERSGTQPSVVLTRTHSIRRSQNVHRSGDRSGSRSNTDSDAEEEEEEEEISRMMSKMFGKVRQEHSEEEKTRHVGVTFKHLTVKGVGLGAAVQPTVGGFFLAPFEKFGKLLNPHRKTSGGAPIKTIIDDFSGVIKPGEMILVLGRPGSGCSTFLKVLGNQRAGFKSVEGSVCYGGVSAETMAKEFRGEVLYNPEDDLHYATLSVKRTLEFALKTRTPGKESRLEGESRKGYVTEFLKTVSKLFWIEHTMKTFVGNENVRGVSGGERKRVSIAEAMITKASTQMWDNSTKGLDASTALEYVKSIRTLTNMTKISTAVALYQAGESLYKAFDKVILLDEGKCCYYGPTNGAAKYFEDLGFAKPARWTTADFLTSVTDEHERKVKEDYEGKIPMTPEAFAEAFRNSDAEKQNWREIEEFESTVEEQRRAREQATSKKTAKKNYTLTFPQQVMACTNRQFFVILGDRQSLIGKWGGILFQGLIVGSLFYDLPKTSQGVFQRGGVMFFLLLFNALLALAELTSAFTSRPILLKHRTFSFYRPSAYAIAQVVIDLPLVAVQVSIFELVVYFMSNLSRTPSQFFISWLIIFLVTLSMYSFFRAAGAFASSLDVATRFTGVAIQALLTYTGYLIPPKKMRPWLSWLRWINPVQYGFEALMANEFYNLRIECTEGFLVPAGPMARPGYQGCTLQGNQPNQPYVDGARYIETSYTYRRSHLWRNIGIIIGMWIVFVVLTCIGNELQKANAGGGAVTVFKRGQAPKSVEQQLDGEKRPDDVEAQRDNDSEGTEAMKTKSSDGVGIARNEKVFTFQNVNYTIHTADGERDLLNNVNGYVKPGELTALMGASGAGKTTLLNILAQRVDTGKITGDFLVDGSPLPLSFQRSTGFAEQNDIHEPTATVREAFRFSALLRQPKEVPKEEKYEYVEKIIDLLEMRNLAGATLGKIGSGLNQEQRKRVTIGVELASKPELLLFLDEPTSGLDSQAAFNVVRFLRKLADAGQAILCTIHQPSAILFEEFDKLLLLKPGGRVVFHGNLGKDSKNMISYFENNGAYKCKPDENPAEYMLEAIGAGDPNYKGEDWGGKWEKSKDAKERNDEIQKMIEERRSKASENEGKEDDREYAMPYLAQMRAVVKRAFVAYWRSPEYFVGKLSLHIITGLFNTFTFWKVGRSQIDMQNRLFSIFLTLVIAPPLIQQLQPKFLDSRAIYKTREGNSKIYAWPAFVMGAILPEIPYSMFCGTIYWACWYWGVGFPHGRFVSWFVWSCIMLFEIFYVGLGQFIAALSPNDLLASLLVPFFFLFVISFAGIVVPYRVLPTFWRRWMYWLTPFHYLLEALLGTVVHGVPIQCDSSEVARFSPPPGETCESYTQGYIAQMGGYVTTAGNGLCELCQFANGDQYAASFNVFYSHKWRNWGLLWAYNGFNFFVVFLLTWLYLGGYRKVSRTLRLKYLNPKKAKALKRLGKSGETSSEG